MSGPRQPTDLIKAKGKKHLSQAEEYDRRQGEVRAKPVNLKNIKIPDFVPESQQKAFKSYVRQLAPLGLYSDLDADTLGQYLVARQSWVNTSALVGKAMQSDDFERAVKLTSMQERYFRQCRTCANALGLTVTSRCRLVIPKVEQDDDDDPLLELLSFPVGADKLG